jgi:hypothetical protein
MGRKSASSTDRVLLCFGTEVTRTILMATTLCVGTPLKSLFIKEIYIFKLHKHPISDRCPRCVSDTHTQYNIKTWTIGFAIDKTP